MVSLVESWVQFDPFLAMGIFWAYVVVDVLYVYYTLYVTRLRPVLAANMSILIYLIVVFGVVNYVGNYLYIVPMALGSWVGTFATVYWEKMKNGVHSEPVKKIHT